jgi:hypothetical protein
MARCRFRSISRTGVVARAIGPKFQQKEIMMRCSLLGTVLQDFLENDTDYLDTVDPPGNRSAKAAELFFKKGKDAEGQAIALVRSAELALWQVTGNGEEELPEDVENALYAAGNFAAEVGSQFEYAAIIWTELRDNRAVEADTLARLWRAICRAHIYTAEGT